VTASGLALFEAAILAYFLIVNTCYAVLLASATLEMVRHIRRTRGEDLWRLLQVPELPRISILSPAYCEEATIVESVSALLTLSYPDLEVVVVCDGSPDGTLDALRRAFSLRRVRPVHRGLFPTRPIRAMYRSRSVPRLLVVDKENGGKADALNAGLNVARGDLVCAIDADTLIAPDALLRLVRAFVTEDGVLAAGGTIRLANGATVRSGRVLELRAPTQLLAGIQVVEYLRAFLFGRLGWDRLGGNLIVSGAFGLFRRDALIAAGGYTHDTVGEDLELIVRLRRQARERGERDIVRFIPDPVAWTEAPVSLAVLSRQRDRWHRGLAETLWRHRGLLLSRRYGALGLVMFPYFVFVELLAPVVEALGLVGLVVGLTLRVVDVPFAVSFFLVAYGYGAILSVATLVLDDLSYRKYRRLRDHFALLGFALIENIGYRQLTVLWRLRGLVGLLRRRSDWGGMEHRGFADRDGTVGHGRTLRSMDQTVPIAAEVSPSAAPRPR
jgi:cellulose synthase/poly-beta-1,6-N-acetylglucosamine synthase-like glycosyltransferase